VAPELEVIADAERTTRGQLRVVLAIMLLVCGIGLIWFLTSDGGGRGMAKMMAASSLGGLFFAIAFLRMCLPSRLCALLEQPERIVWYYTVDGAPAKVMIGDDGGRIHWAEFQSFPLKERALAALELHAPRARFGYSEEARAAFKKNPQGFRLPDSGKQ